MHELWCHVTSQGVGVLLYMAHFEGGPESTKVWHTHVGTAMVESALSVDPKGSLSA